MIHVMLDYVIFGTASIMYTGTGKYLDNLPEITKNGVEPGNKAMKENAIL